jgi:DNA-binding LytR/AlgR family response regulator
MTINCIAIDDEPLALDIIEDYIKKVPFLNHVHSFDNALSAIEYLKENPVDLMFLDIQMEELTGIQMLSVLTNNRPNVILTTAYENYALQGYELDVADYLLKPISFDRFLKAVNKVYEALTLKKNNGNQTVKLEPKKEIEEENFDYFFVKTETRLQKVYFNDILFIEGQGDYLRIITKSEKIMTLQNFKKMESALPKTNFIRVHKSYMVAIDKIESIERSRIKIGDKLLPISDTYKNNFNEELEKRGLI